MLEVILISPGSTVFDEEGRIKGCTDIPLSSRGEQQADSLAHSLEAVKIDCIYTAPCESAQISAEKICERNFCKRKVLPSLRNLDHGLWQGKLVKEVKRLQPKVYRQFQEHPLDVCPPQGETIEAGLNRVHATLDKLHRKHEGGRIGLIIPQPMTSLVRYALVGGSFGDIWKAEADFGAYEIFRVEGRSEFKQRLAELAV